MRRFLIEREIAGASDLTDAQLAAIATKSNTVAASLGVSYRWITSYVAGAASTKPKMRKRSASTPNEIGPHTADLPAASG